MTAATTSPQAPGGTAQLAGRAVARVGFGAMQLAERPGGNPALPRDAALTVLRRAVERGVNHIDTAQFYGDGTASRDYVHVDDISNALQLALEKNVPGGTVLHAASGVETAVRDLADLCRRAAGVPDHPIEYRPKRAGEVGRNFASYDLASQLLGYAPSVAREVGIPRTWKWFQEEVFRD